MIKDKTKVHLVTGGAGFIGSHIIDSLMHSGEKVICLDNLSNGSLNNIKQWLNNDNFIYEKFIERGNLKISSSSEYNSHNTKMLNKNSMIKKLHKVDSVIDALKNIKK